LRNFVTLSPAPGFANWLKRERANGDASLLNEHAREALTLLDQPGWHLDPARAERVQPAVLAAATNYFLKAKNGNGLPLDPVARFHLGNGARLERLNFLGDTSPNGLRQAHGLMVNYLYALDEIEKNHEAYAEKGVVAASSALRKALRAPNGT
jgi:malonyl-CoA decarboxylase